MKKFFKLGKRMLALFIVVLLNINSYAAVGANDGSAFVTKAEFDALVNTFNEQMDTYQSSINAKIDGAIANYLAGLSSVQQVKKNIIYSNWNDISCFNGVIDPEFETPEINILIAGGINNTFSWTDGGSWDKIFALPIAVRYTYGANEGKKRPLFVPEKEETDIGKIYWGGIAPKYKEKFSIALGIYLMSSNDMANVEGSGAATFRFDNSTVIKTTDGFNNGLETNPSILDPKIKWNGPGKSYYNDIEFNNKTCSTVATVKLDKYNSKGDTIEYDHIIQYDKNNEWWLSNETFTKTMMKHEDNTIMASTVLNKITKSSNISRVGARYRNGSSSTSDRIRGSINVQYETPNDAICPSVGMLNEAVKAQNIYLTKDEVYYDKKNVPTKLETKTLEKGFPLFYAEKDAQIKWSPRFTEGTTYSSTAGGWVPSSATRVKLLFSVGEFTDKIASTNIISADSPEGKTTDGGVLCKICKQDKDEATQVSFKMPKDGIVYAKWVPDTSAYDAEQWIQPLELKSCNTYLETTE